MADVIGISAAVGLLAVAAVWLAISIRDYYRIPRRYR